ncbi:Eukaryotic translation initiation factor 2D [Phlyctochytrium bullatum]|nr:Eukaryotic translation initiation factor 2D [Phlyctochytrium bullatum]
MFKKSYQVRTQTTVRSSDRRKLRGEILNTFPSVTEEQLNEIFPSKEGKDGEGEMTAVKFTAHSGAQGLVYVVGNQPLFARIEDVLIPTVYTLWAIPHMLPVLVTHGVVMKKLFDGADLMLPGVIVPADKFANASWEAGDPVAVVIRGNPFPLAVGTMFVSSAELRKPGFEMRGKGLRTVHTYGDTLWASGSKSEPPEVPEGAAVENDDVDEEEYEVVFEEDGKPEDSVENSVTKLSLRDARDDDDDEDDDGEEIPVAPSVPVAALTPADHDKLLEQSLITAIKTKLPDDAKSYPISSSVLWESHILPSRPAGTTLDVKASSHKKLGKFLKVMEKKGYIKLKERGGDTLLMSVNKKHPDITSFEPPRVTAATGASRGSGMVGVPSSVAAASGSTSGSGTSGATLSVVELYRASAAVAKIWQEVGLSKDMYCTRADVKAALEDYFKQKGLASSDDPRLVKMDALLAEAVLKKDEGDVDFLMRDSLLTRVLEKMNPFYELTLPDQDPVIRKGSLKPINVTVETRQGRRMITRVVGMEAFGIDPEDLAAQLKIRCASSTTVSALPGKSSNTLYEVMAQGSKIREVCECLAEKYHIPFTGKGGKTSGVINYGLKGGPQSKYVETLDKT